MYQGYVARGGNICSRKYPKDETNFLVHKFVENRHGRNRMLLESISKKWNYLW